MLVFHWLRSVAPLVENAVAAPHTADRPCALCLWAYACVRLCIMLRLYVCICAWELAIHLLVPSVPGHFAVASEQLEDWRTPTDAASSFNVP